MAKDSCLSERDVVGVVIGVVDVVGNAGVVDIVGDAGVVDTGVVDVDDVVDIVGVVEFGVGETKKYIYWCALFQNNVKLQL